MKLAEYYLMKPKVDFCFKELMNDPYVRRGFIATLLKLDPEKIKETSLLPTIHGEKTQGWENRNIRCPCSSGRWHTD